MRELGPFTRSAVHGLGLDLDGRQLVPLDEARLRVRAVDTFARGDSRKIPGQTFQPCDSDFLWAALLSLEDAKEFVREASRLEWKFSPRGFDNVAPLERYGDAILPWLARFVAEDGRLAPNPWCVDPCLQAIASTDALALVLRIRTVDDPSGREHVRAWLRRHEEAGWRALADLADAGNELAKKVIAAEAKRAPAAAKEILARATTAKRASALLRGHAKALAPEAILEVLDDAASSESDDPLPWPWLRGSVGHFEVHAIRVVAARSKSADDWGVLFEVVQGDVLEGPDRSVRWPATIQQYRYGSRVPPGGHYLEDARAIGMYCVPPVEGGGTDPKGAIGVKVVGPKGTKPFVVTEALAASLDLRVGRACSKIDDWPSVVAIRARLARDPDAFWVDPKPLAKTLLGIADPVVVVTTDRFEHVSGPGSNEKGEAGRLPSASPTFRSIAAAIAHRDKKRFVPGQPNTDWRLLVR